MPSAAMPVEVRRSRPARVAVAEAADVGVAEVVGEDDDEVRRAALMSAPAPCGGAARSEAAAARPSTLITVIALINLITLLNPITRITHHDSCLPSRPPRCKTNPAP